MFALHTLVLLAVLVAGIVDATFPPHSLLFQHNIRGARQASFPHEPLNHSAHSIRPLATSRREAASRMINFTRRHNAVECLQRIICQLSFDDMYFGKEGLEFGQRLQKLETIVKESEIIPYRNARSFGMTNQDPENCVQRYNHCAFKPNEIIRFGLRMMKRIPEQ